MTSLLPRQERFCQYFILRPNATHAADHAGYAPRTSDRQGSRLLANARVSARIQELRADIAKRHCADADQLMGKLEAIYRRASEDHHWGAAGRAVELQARLAGVMPQWPRRRPSDAPDSGENVEKCRGFAGEKDMFLTKSKA